jgi:Leucine-rich repeat (LRR) protein
LSSSSRHFLRLEQLSVCQSIQSGTFPEWLTQLSTIGSLEVFANSMADTLPPSIGNMTSLQLFDVRDTRFAGAPPLSLQGLIPLENIYLDGNLFSIDLATLFSATVGGADM